MKIGVLAVQGNFREHLAMLARLGVNGVEVRKPEHLEGLDGLIIPGGESTAIGRLIRLYGLERAFAAYPGPVLGTCAGMILLAREAVDGVPDQPLLGAIDISVRRNGYGRQVMSFEADVALSWDERPFGECSSARRASLRPGPTSKRWASSTAILSCSAKAGSSSRRSIRS